MRILDSLTTARWPRVQPHALANAKKYTIIFCAIFLSVVLSGKGRCFGVMLAHFQNKTCTSPAHRCSSSFLNFVGDLSVAIPFAGSPFVSGVLIRMKQPALGGRTTLQAAVIVLIGCLASNFVVQPDSLLVTDSVIQGLGTSVLVSVIAIRLTELFPRESRYHVLVSAFTDAGPWGTIVVCPLFAVILQSAHWQQVYLFVAILLIAALFVATVVEPRNPDQPVKVSFAVADPAVAGPSSTCPDHREHPCQSYEEVNEIEFWENGPSPYSGSSGEDSEEPRPAPAPEPLSFPPDVKNFFFNSETGQILREGTSLVWLVERALHTMVLYNVILNLVDYMVVEIQESLEKASLVMMSFGGGEVIGFVIAVSLGDQLRHHLLHIYTIATFLLSILLLAWHITQALHINSFANGDAHFLALLCGLIMAFTSGYTYALAEDVLCRPGLIAYPLTRFFQALGLIFAPLTSGVVIQYDRYKSFFLIQTILTFIRLVLLCLLIYKLKRKKLVHDASCLTK